MKTLYATILLSLGIVGAAWGQFNPNNPPNDCPEAVPGCSTPSFPISPNVAGTNNYDFGTGTVSNPSTNPNSSPGNAGCLLSGETSSTFITIQVVSSGTLAWSIQGASGGCFDWIMWPLSNLSTTCPAIANNQLAPVSCNWNGACGGFTGMCPPGGLPAGANQSNFENSLMVTAGQSYLLCLSNYSGTSQNVNLNFFGTANVACSPSSPDQTICIGSSAQVTIATPGLTSPTFQWLVTNGVSNTSGGTNVTVTPTVTTTYQVKVMQGATATAPAYVDTATFTIFVENPPTPNAGLDDTLCFGTPINLTGTVSNPSNMKSWSFFNVGISPNPVINFSPNYSSLTPTVSVNQPGQYGFVLRETSPVCGIRRDTVMIYMKQMTATSNVTSPTCAGYTDGEVVMSGPQASQYSFDNGSTWGTSDTGTGFSAGNYNMCVKDIYGCQACIPVQIIDRDPVQIMLSNDTLICENGTATMNAQGVSGNSFLYHWDHTGDMSSTQSIQPISAAFYPVFAENEFGCQSDVDSIYVDVRPAISGDVTLNDTVCPGYSTMLTANAADGFGGPFNFAWSNGGAGTGLSHTITVSPASTMQYQVTITDNCESTPLVLTSEVFVSPVPVPSFTVDTTAKCEPAVFELSITSPAGTWSNSAWNIANGQFYLDQDTVYNGALSSGSYDVQLILTNQQGCIDSVTYPQFLNAMKLPEAIFRFSPGQPTMFNTKVQFDNLSIDGANYEWTFEKATPGTSNEVSPNVLFPDGYAGNYEVQLVVITDFGCRDSIFNIVEVIPEVIVFAPNTFTPDGDQHNQNWFVVIEGIDVYDFELEIRDRWGKVIWESNNPDAQWDGTFNGKPVTNGVYTWNIRAKDFSNDKQHLFSGLVQVLR